jgi:phosphoglycerol transferase MdoB-like AlkP superfamily enzyme
MRSIYFILRFYLLSLFGLFLTYQYFKILFWAFNRSAFSSLDIQTLWGAWYFDFASIALTNLPLVLLLLLSPFVRLKHFCLIFSLFFVISNTPWLLINSVDIAYFAFTNKRSTIEVLKLMSEETAAVNILTSLAISYWHVLVLSLLGFVFLISWQYFQVRLLTKQRIDAIKMKQLLPLLLLLLSCQFVMARGGIGTRPLEPIVANKFCVAENIPLVLNSTFTLYFSHNIQSITPKIFFDEKTLNQAFNPLHAQKKEIPAKKNNVVLLILESVSAEFLKTLNPNQDKNLMPFLDSLASEGILFDNFYANGLRSADMPSAIFSTMPHLMEDSFVFSNYSSNNISSIPKVLKKYGYQSYFFHGAKNGSMRMDGFANSAKFDAFYGMSEYPNPNEYDGAWGIYDAAFLQFFNNTLNQAQQPFFASIFTLSTHNPYTLPDSLLTTFAEPGDDYPIYKTLRYLDKSLSDFFSIAKQSAWFADTYFIITADHVAAESPKQMPKYKKDYAVPLIIFKTGIESQTNHKIGKHVDIAETVFDVLALPYQMVSFGESLFAQTPGYVVLFHGSYYSLTSQQFQLLYNIDNDKVIGFFDIQKDPTLTVDVQELHAELLAQHILLLKAYLQSYQTRIVGNKLYEDF